MVLIGMCTFNHFAWKLQNALQKKERMILIQNLEKKTSAIRHEKINHVKNLFLFIDGIGKELDCQILTLFALVVPLKIHFWRKRLRHNQWHQYSQSSSVLLSQVRYISLLCYSPPTYFVTCTHTHKHIHTPFVIYIYFINIAKSTADPSLDCFYQ